MLVELKVIWAEISARWLRQKYDKSEIYAEPKSTPFHNNTSTDELFNRKDGCGVSKRMKNTGI